MRRTTKRGCSIFTTAAIVAAVFLLTISVSAQTIAEPGNPVTIGSSTGFSESVSDCGGLNSCGVEYNTSANTMGAVTALSGIGSGKSASITLLNRFEVTGDNDRVLGARLAGRVTWSGDLQSFGAIGAAAFASVRVSVVDVSTGLTVGGQTLMDEECETFVLIDSCLRRIDGSGAVNIPFQVQRGREYEIRFNLTCESNSGIGDANCVFNQNGAFPLAGGSVGRSDLTLSIEADIVGLLEEIQDELALLRAELREHDEEVQAQISAHDMKIEGLIAEHDERLADHEASEAERFEILLEAIGRNFDATLESIRLLLTPQGRRSTEYPVCNGEPCSFPHGANAGSVGDCDNGNGNGTCGNGQGGDNGNSGGSSGGGGDTGGGSDEGSGSESDQESSDDSDGSLKDRWKSKRNG